ncbi:aspartate kinase [Halobacteriovorax sp.]|uniref:aspartate kinase n=1 Tax=Halobacteriovorax sp. TaxID=2020862 RepID=UPI003AF1E6AF
MRSIYKFGGSSIKCAATIKQIADLIIKCPNNCLVVLSATYNSTNELEEIFETSNLDLVKAFFNKHQVIIDELETSTDLSDFQSELESYLKNEKTKSVLDSVYSIGERVSTRILSDYLQKREVHNHLADARDYITTNRNFNEAKVLFKNTKDKCHPLNEKELIITQGFIAKTLSGETSTLGREGSDYSAAIFAWALDDVRELVIWKDVKGIYGHDPKLLDSAPLIPNLSYRQTKLLTNKGAKILFHRTMNPLIEKNLPLIVKSVFFPDESGSCISEGEVAKLKAISTQEIDGAKALLTVFGLDYDQSLVTNEHPYELDENNDDYFSLEVRQQDLAALINLFGDHLFSSHK